MTNKKQLARVEEKILSESEAQKLEDGIVADFGAAENALVQAAIKLERFIRGRGWQALGFETLGEWKKDRVKHCQFYQLRRVQAVFEKYLSDGIPESEAVRIIGQMKLTNIETMATQLPPSEWTKSEWQKAAIEMPVADFERKAVAASEEAGMHVEEVFRRGFMLPRTLAEMWDQSLRVAEIVDGCEHIDAKVEAICGAYLHGAGKQPGTTRLQRYYQLRPGDTESV